MPQLVWDDWPSSCSVILLPMSSDTLQSMSSYMSSSCDGSSSPLDASSPMSCPTLAPSARPGGGGSDARRGARRSTSPPPRCTRSSCPRPLSYRRELELRAPRLRRAEISNHETTSLRQTPSVGNLRIKHPVATMHSSYLGTDTQQASGRPRLLNAGKPDRSCGRESCGLAISGSRASVCP